MTTRWAVALLALALPGCGDGAGTPAGTAVPAPTGDATADRRPGEGVAPPQAPQTDALPTMRGETVTTDSGLQYTVDRPGEPGAPVAEPPHVVAVHCTGTLADGTKFVSSRDRGQPIQFPLGVEMVIPGWDEGVAGMRVGERRTLVIPPELGYGQSPRRGSSIPPNATLHFEVELVDIPVRVTIDRPGEGDGAMPGHQVRVHYTGWLEGGPRHGEQFDSSRGREPSAVLLGARRVIPGWDMGLIGAKKGEQRTLIIAPEMAYGPRGQGQIPPNATLKFEIEVIDVVMPRF